MKAEGVCIVIHHIITLKTVVLIKKNTNERYVTRESFYLFVTFFFNIFYMYLQHNAFSTNIFISVVVCAALNSS